MSRHIVGSANVSKSHNSMLTMHTDGKRTFVLLGRDQKRQRVVDHISETALVNSVKETP